MPVDAVLDALWKKYGVNMFEAEFGASGNVLAGFGRTPDTVCISLANSFFVVKSIDFSIDTVWNI